jgi:hypothetical protein
MPTESEFQYHRTFLSLPMCRTIYNEDERYQNKNHFPNGPPNREAKVKSDAVYAYHVHSCPRYPQRAPGLPVDRVYGALLARDNGTFDPLMIIPKRGQDFSKVAELWERSNSMLCSEAGSFRPIVNSSMEVTGHYANRYSGSVVHPKGIQFDTLAEYIDKGVDIHFKPPGNIPDGWQDISSSHDWQGGIDLYVLPNGKIVDGEGFRFASNNGHALPSWSPLDFFSPGRKLAAKLIRSFTNRVATTGRSAWRYIKPPTRESAQLAVSRLSGKTLTGMAVSSRGVLPVQTAGRRTIIMGDDMAGFKKALQSTPTEVGFFDIVIHGDVSGFWIRQQGRWVSVSVKDVANAVRPHLKVGDKIRLMACATGRRGDGPARQLANELKRTVWAPSQPIYPVYGKATHINPNGSAHIDDFDVSKAVVPVSNGKFYEFEYVVNPAKAVSTGRPVNAHVIKRDAVPKK